MVEPVLASMIQNRLSDSDALYLAQLLLEVSNLKVRLMRCRNIVIHAGSDKFSACFSEQISSKHHSTS